MFQFLGFPYATVSRLAVSAVAEYCHRFSVSPVSVSAGEILDYWGEELPVEVTEATIQEAIETVQLDPRDWGF